MFELGRICVKTQGRDATKICCIIDKIDENTVFIDGDTRRRKVNIAHLEPLDKVLKIKKNEETKNILSELEKAGFKVSKNPNKKPTKEKKEQVKKVKNSKNSDKKQS